MVPAGQPQLPPRVPAKLLDPDTIAERLTELIDLHHDEPTAAANRDRIEALQHELGALVGTLAWEDAIDEFASLASTVDAAAAGLRAWAQLSRRAGGLGLSPDALGAWAPTPLAISAASRAGYTWSYPKWLAVLNGRSIADVRDALGITASAEQRDLDDALDELHTWAALPTEAGGLGFSPDALPTWRPTRDQLIAAHRAGHAWSYPTWRARTTSAGMAGIHHALGLPDRSAAVAVSDADQWWGMVATDARCAWELVQSPKVIEFDAPTRAALHAHLASAEAALAALDLPDHPNPNPARAWLQELLCAYAGQTAERLATLTDVIGKRTVAGEIFNPARESQEALASITWLLAGPEATTELRTLLVVADQEGPEGRYSHTPVIVDGVDVTAEIARRQWTLDKHGRYSWVVRPAGGGAPVDTGTITKRVDEAFGSATRVPYPKLARLGHPGLASARITPRELERLAIQAIEDTAQAVHDTCQTILRAMVPPPSRPANLPSGNDADRYSFGH